MLQGDWENAICNFETAVQYDWVSDRVVRYLADCYFQSGDNEKAIRFFEELAKIKSNDFTVRYTLAILYDTAEKYRKAIAEYKLASECEVKKKDQVYLTDTLYKLAEFYMEEQMVEEGAACYLRMLDLKLVTDPAKIYYVIGQNYFEKNDILKAIDYFIRTKEADPLLNSVYFYLTLCYDQIEDYSNAEKEAKKYLSKDPDNWAMHLALSEIYRKTGNELQGQIEIEKTEEILQLNVIRGSRYPKEYFLLCQIYRNQKRNTEAIATIESLRLIPLDTETRRDLHYLLATLYYEENQFDRVEEELRMTLKLDPDFHGANNFLGYLLAETNKNLDEAIGLINRALKVQPENGAYLDSLGWAYYKKAQAEGEDSYLFTALQKLTEAIRLTKEPEIYDHAGDVYFSLGRWDDAVLAWEKALELYKDTVNSELHRESVDSKLKRVQRLFSFDEKKANGIVNHTGAESIRKP
ncbi:MAG: tetratricopeptide repeat protein [Candidatus Brocadiaceae bacterium]|nr:tetratricopeptide repeat protein [Candidatus Brocadiaceae bacterium]